MTETACRSHQVYLVDDHHLVRRGLRLLIDLEPNLIVCGEADNGPTALEEICIQQPDLAVVDLNLRNSSGLDLIRRLTQECPGLKVLVFSMHNDAFHVKQALQVGAHGYVIKEESTENVVGAIKEVLRGGTYFSRQLMLT